MRNKSAPQQLHTDSGAFLHLRLCMGLRDQLHVPTHLPSENVPELIPVAALSKASVCCRSHAGIAGLNPVGIMDVSLL